MKPIDFFLLVSEHRMLIRRIGLYYRHQTYEELNAVCPVLMQAERMLAHKIDEVVGKCITTALEQAPDDAIDKIYNDLKITRPNESKEENYKNQQQGSTNQVAEHSSKTDES